MKFKLYVFCVFTIFSGMALSESIPNTKITLLSVSGTDGWTTSPGTTCLQVSGPVSDQCPSGVIAIPGNHNLLVSAAMTAVTTGKDIWLYYKPTTNSYHCPGLTFTPCEVLNIGLRP